MANIDMTMSELFEIPEAVAIFDKHLPGLTENEQLMTMGMGMSFRTITKFSKASMPPDIVAKIEAELQAL